MTSNAVEELERERSELLSENAMLKEELKKVNDYMDNHINK